MLTLQPSCDLVFEICSARSRQWQDVVLRCIAPWVQCKKTVTKLVFEIYVARWLQCEGNMSQKPGKWRNLFWRYVTHVDEWNLRSGSAKSWMFAVRGFWDMCWAHVTKLVFNMLTTMWMERLQTDALIATWWSLVFEIWFGWSLLRAACVWVSWRQLSKKSNHEMKVWLTLAVDNADSGLVVSSGAGRTLDTVILTSLRLVRATGTVHAPTTLSGKVLPCPTRLCAVHSYV